MIRAVINTFPDWASLTAVTLGAMLLSVAAIWALRRWLPHIAHAERSDLPRILMGTVGGFYGLILGFVIFATWGNVGRATEAVSLEATTFAEILRSSLLLSTEDQAILQRAVGTYVVAVRLDEWPNMRTGAGRAQTAYDAMTGVYIAVGKLHPTGTVEVAGYQTIVKTTNDAYTARRGRLDRAEVQLPAALTALLFAGAAVIEGFIVLLASTTSRTERAMAVLVNGLITLTLALALLFEYPFSANLGIDDRPFTVGVLAQFNAQVTAAQQHR